MLRSILRGLAAFYLILLTVEIASAAEPSKKKSPEPEPAEIEAREHVRQALLAETLADSAQRDQRLNAALLEFPSLEEAHWHLGRVRVGGRWLPLADAEALAAKDATLRKYRQQRDAAKNAKMLQALARWCTKTGWQDEAKLHSAQILQNPEATAAMREEAMERLDLRSVNGIWITGDEMESREQAAKSIEGALTAWRPKLKSLQLQIDSEDFARRDAAIAELHSIQDRDVIPGLESFLIEGGDEFHQQAVLKLAEFKEYESTEALVQFAVLSRSVGARDKAMTALANRPLHEFVPLLIAGLSAPIKARFDLQRTAAGRIDRAAWLTRETPFETQMAAFLVSTRPVTGAAWNAKTREVLGNPLNEQAFAARREFFSAQLAVENAQATIGLVNQQLDLSNAPILKVLTASTGEKIGNDAAQWWSWWRNYNEYHWPSRTTYCWARIENTYAVPVFGASCFLAGTPVRTQTGLVAIETIQPGDRVLAQDQDTGELTYKLVLRTTLRPPADMLKITAGSEEIVTTLGHPFWVSGHGWRMAKQLKEGDLLHGVAGAVRIEALEALAKQPAHNLVVADFNTYFVGEQGLLVHDNEYRKPTRSIVPGLAAE